MSCGCAHKDAITRHGLYAAGGGRTTHPLFPIWAAIIKRCLNAESRDYHRYGGRGISVCDEWLDFDRFVSDLGPRPSDGHTVDRKDNDKGYEPGNCRWATYSQQQNNRSDNRRMEFNGENLTISEWATRLGIKASTLHARIGYGWPVERILTSPVAVADLLEHDDVSLTISEWAQRTGITEDAIRDRLKRGWTVDKALTRPLQRRRSK